MVGTGTKEMHCSLQRSLSDRQTVSHGEKSYSSRKFIEQDSFKGSSEVCEVSALDCGSSDQRCALLTFLRLESSEHRRIVALPMRCIDRTNQARSEVNENMDSLCLVTQPTSKSHKVNTPNAQIGPGFGVTHSMESFTARRNFSGTNWQHASRNKATANNMSKPDDFSSYSTCWRSISCSDSCALTSRGSTTMSSSDVLIDITELDKVVKKASKKKVRRKGKYKKKFPSDTVSNELKVLFEKNAHRSSTSETCANNDLDHGDEVGSCVTSQEVSALDDVGGTDFKATTNKLAKMLIPCNNEMDIVETAVPSFSPLDLATDGEMGIQTIAQGFSIVDRGLEETTNVQISYDHDACLKGSSDTSDSLVLDLISISSFRDDNTDATHDVQEPDKGDRGIAFPGLPGLSSGKKYFSHQNSFNGGVDTSDSDGRTNNSSRGFSGSGMPQVSLGKRGKQVKTIPRSCGVYKPGSFGNSHGHIRKENNHSIWQKVQKKDVNECRYESENVSPVLLQSQVDITLKETSFPKRNWSVAEMCKRSRTKDKMPLKDKVSGRLKRKSSPGLKQEFHCYAGRVSHHNRASSNGHAKMNMGISTNVNVQYRINSVLKSRSQSCCPRVELLSSRAESMNPETVHSSQIFPDPLEPLENVHDIVSGMNIQSRTYKDLTLPKSCLSLDASKLHGVRSPVFLPQIDKELSLERKRQNNSSGSILQKWIPTGKKDRRTSITAECELLLVEHSHGPADEDRIFKSTVEKKVESKSENLVSPQNIAGLMCQCSSWEERNVKSLRHSDACLFKGHDNNTNASECPMSVSNNRNCSAFETDSHRIQLAVIDVCRVQMAAEAVHVATGGPIAELERLLHLSSPVIHQFPNLICCRTCSQDMIVGATLCRHETPNVSLGCLWQWYEKHGSYGLEVRAEECENSKRFGVDRFAFRAYFVPFLSAVQLFSEHKQQPMKDNIKLSPSAVVEACELGGTLENSSVSHLPIFSMFVPPPRTSNMGIPALTDDMHHSQPASVYAKEDLPSQSADSASSSYLELLFEYFESEQPQQRRPLYEKIQELVIADEPSEGSMYGDPMKLNSVNLHDLHPRSWFSVAWYPIYRIPDGNLRAAFLTYHSLGHFVHRRSKFDSARDGCIIYPVVGLQSYNAQGECWFQLRPSTMSPTAETSSLHPSGILKERLRTLEESASLFSRAVVNKGNRTGNNRHHDYEFFLSRRR